MTLDEAIKHCNEVAEAIAISGCEECAKEYRQLAEWLQELKTRRSLGNLPEQSDYETNYTTKSEDLEEEITKCYKSRTDLMMTRNQFGELINRFTELQKKQMMKDAVDATILDIDAQTIEFGLWPEKLLDIKEGDKVKIIVIKEN